MTFKRICIIGVGLIGGSLGMALKEWGYPGEVIGVSSAKTIKEAIAKGAIDRGFSDLSKGVAEADLIILATPLGASISKAQELALSIKAGAIVTDVGSTKNVITRVMEETLPQDCFFVGGHPMAGSEKTGIEAADPFIIENAIYVLTKSNRTSVEALEQVQDLVSYVKAQPVIMNPEEHDKLVASISHLPHLAAVSLVNAALGKCENGIEKEKLLSLAAGGFRDTTRVAAGSPIMWRDICFTNKEAIIPLLEEMKEELTLLQSLISNDMAQVLVEKLEQAADLRREMPSRGKNIVPAFYDVVVLVKDTPGMIGMLATLLGEKGLNINEIEILRVREEKEGSIRIAFNDLEARDEALIVLQDKGIQAWKR